MTTVQEEEGIDTTLTLTIAGVMITTVEIEVKAEATVDGAKAETLVTDIAPRATVDVAVPLPKDPRNKRTCSSLSKTKPN